MRKLIQPAAFLYVAENEGLSTTELTQLLRTPIASGARIAKMLAGQWASPLSVLVEIRAAPRDGRLQLLHLNEPGRALRRRLDRIIRDADPIVSGRAAPPPWSDRSRRRRDSVLAAVEAFRGLPLPQSLHLPVMFLYVCENEGATPSELAKLAGVSTSACCKILKALAARTGGADGAALVEFDGHDDHRLRPAVLTRAGQALRGRLDELIAQAVTIG